MALYEIAVMLIETEGKDGEILEEELLVGPKFVMAKSDKTAAYKFIIEQAETLKGQDPERIKVLVRPFV